MDANREVRAMLFSCLHLPPLPAVVSRVGRDDNLILEDAVESSHGLIGNMIEWVALARDHAKDGQRMQEQFALLAQFKADLLGLDLDTCSDEALYGLYCDHTRRWLGCYAKFGDGARFMPVGHVAAGDRIHRNMQDYCKAQHFHATDGQALHIETSVPYASMLRRCAEWMRHAFLADGDPLEETNLID